MSRMHPLDPFEVTLRGSHLIEAAAGTGKTWTIAALYLRLILEADVLVPNVLVVTYTRAATGELKQRLREALETAVAAFKNKDAKDHPLISPLLARSVTPNEDLRKLQRALAYFDQAAVFTIHGFCERVLSDYAFQSAGAFETERLADEQALFSEVVDDLWRTEMYSASRSWSSWLAAYKGLRHSDDLGALLRPLVAKPFLKVVGEQDSAAAEPFDNALTDAFSTLVKEWRSSRDTISSLLLDPNASLNRNRYRPSSVQKWLVDLDDFFSDASVEFPKVKALDYLEKLTQRFLSSGAAVRKGGVAPEHPFFGQMGIFLDALDVHNNACREYFVYWASVLRQRADAALLERKRTLGLQSYDDLLLGLKAALEADAEHVLRSQLQAGFQAALLDEFQDTDPVQYGIFRAVYGDDTLPVFMVGDPKQAIYSFRGADLFSYLRARGDASARHTLRANYRACKGLVDAVNAVFSHLDRSSSFVFDQIAFDDAIAVSEAPALSGDTRSGDLVVWHIARDDESTYLSKGATREAIARVVASEISDLLSGGKTLNGRDLTARDLAILVRSHVEGQIIQQALNQANIPCVRQGQQSVYQTHEAMELERVLQAVAHPRREALIRAALLTDLMGYDLPGLQALEQDLAGWDQTLDRFHEWNEIWRESGFMKMFRKMVSAEGIFSRLNRHRDNDRRLTNIIHLSERIEAAAEQHHEMSTLLNWLATVRADPPAGEDESLLRLDSDEDRVRIVTIHASKGLQYPVVFLPFAWDSGSSAAEDRCVFFHDPSNENRTSVDLGTEALDAHKERAEVERLAENVRLLYVGLTRAESRCYLAWGGITGAAKSALAWLLHREKVDAPPERLSELERHFATLSDIDLEGALTALASRSGGAIEVLALDEKSERKHAAVAVALPALSARPASRAIDRSWRLSSFSALATGHESSLPDHDRSPTFGAPSHSESFFGFPRGARAGTCLHRMFELIDFGPDSVDAQRLIVRQTLNEFGFEDKWTPVVMQMLQTVLSAPLNTRGLKLNAIDRRHRVDEMAFCFQTDAFDHMQWAQVLRCHVDSAHPALRKASENDFFAPPAGFMQGFIDLVFESDGRFYLVDYKSNFLGSDFPDYAPSRLAEAMVQSQYTLQYLIYTVALNRWLERVLPDYRYDRHFGGVFYLFLRGMTPQAHDSGVFFDRPPAELVSDLTALMEGSHG